MADTFLSRTFRKLMGSQETPRGVLLGAFGKHPATPEHFDDLDGEPILSKLREILYTKGVQAAVDNGVWKELRETGIALPFRHALVWRFENNLIVGRMVSSRDKLGRDRYPFMVIAVCPNQIEIAGFQFGLTRVLPWVERITDACVDAPDMAELKAVINEARHSAPALPDIAALPTADDSATESLSATAFLARCDPFKQNHTGLVNILYQIDREMGGFAPMNPGATASRSRAVLQRSAHLRVPRCSDSRAEAVAAWLQFLRAYIADSVSILLFVPDPSGDSWIDIVVGTSVEADLFCLRSSSATMPLTNSIPYTIPPDFFTATEDRISRALQTFNPSATIFVN